MTNYKIRAIHIVTEPNINEKEKISVKNLKAFCEYSNIEYFQAISEIYKKIPPAENCARPDHIDLKPRILAQGHGSLTPAHYGCFLAHANAIRLHNNKNYDFILVFEGDAFIDVEFAELLSALIRFYEIAKRENLCLVGLSNYYLSLDNEDYLIEDVHCNLKYLIEAQGCLIPCSKLQDWENEIINKKWDVWDLWVTNFVDLKRGISNKIYIKEIEGMSLLTGCVSDPTKVGRHYASEEKLKAYR